MEEKIRLCTAVLCAWGLCMILSASLSAQPPSNQPRFSPVLDANINGFWEYLPRNYSTDITQTYPLLVFIHGFGESGATPDPDTLRRVLNNATPKLTGNGTFPDSFFVSGQWFKFIVISPQIKNGFLDLNSTIQPSTIDAVIEYAKSAYRVDPTRIYLGGLSMGGGAVWDYAGSSAAAAQKLGAVVIAAGAADLDSAQAGIIAGAGLPLIATHNTVDDQILATRTQANIAAIQRQNPLVQPRAFYWSTPGSNGGKHNVWTRTFETLTAGASAGGNLVDSLGTTVYHWMLQHQRSSGTLLPLVWKSFTADRRGNTVVLTWKTSLEQNLKGYEAEKSYDGQTWKIFASLSAAANSDSLHVYSVTDLDPYQAITYYRIKQIDLDGKRSYSVIEKSIQATAAPVRVYPSPFKETLTILFTGPVQANLHVMLLNAAGSVVVRQRISQAARPGTRISLSGLQSLPSGLYYVKITDQNGVLAIQKVFK